MKSPPLRLQGDHHGRDDKPYHASPELLTAANTALLLETPLLLAGEPGCGKTDFTWYAARALAQALKQPDYAKRVPLECYIHSDTSATELLYQYDSLARFADSQGRPDCSRGCVQRRCATRATRATISPWSRSAGR